MLSLIGGQVLAAEKVGPLTMTALITVASGIVASLGIALVGTRQALSHIRGTNTFMKLWLGSALLLLLVSSLSTVFEPTWDGLQLTCSLWAAFITASFAYLHPTSEIFAVLIRLTVWIMLLATVLHGLMHLFLEFPGFDWRDRGEILVLTVALGPLATGKKLMGIAISVCFLIGVVLTDSRFSSLVAVVILSIWVYFFVREDGPVRALLASGFFTVLLVCGITFSQQLLGLRRSLPFSWLGNGNGNGLLPSGQFETAPVLESIGESSSPANSWSSGRAEVWVSLLSQEKNFFEWLVGQGTGTASQIGSSINPSFQHPHNEAIRFFVDLGVLGLIAFAGLGLFGLLVVWREFSPNNPKRCAALVSLGVAFFAHSLVSNPVTSVHFFLAFSFFFGGLLNRSVERYPQGDD